MLAMASLSAWQPPVIDTVAMTGEGVEELAGQLEHHRCWLVDSGVGVRRRAERAERELRSVVVARLAERAEHLCTGAAWAAALQSVTSGGTDPWSAAEGLLRDGFR
jgi:LAO/AO transport system kinase